MKIKTSNKLLLGLLLTMLVCIAAFMAYAKMNAKPRIKGDGNVTSEVRNAGKFTKIYAEGNVKVYLTQENTPKVEVKADKNIISDVETTILDDVLNIKLKKGVDTNRVSVFVSADTITEINITAGSFLETKGQLKGSKLNLTATAGSNAVIDLAYNVLEFTSMAGASLNLKGSVYEARWNLMAGSVTEASQLAIQKLTLSANAGSTAEVSVSEELTADVSTGASISYKGSPKVKNLNNSTGGSINKID